MAHSSVTLNSQVKLSELLTSSPAGSYRAEFKTRALTWVCSNLSMHLVNFLVYALIKMLSGMQTDIDNSWGFWPNG